jgi:hypothetical protein
VKNKTLLLLGGGLLAAYFLSRNSSAASNGSVGGGSGSSGLLGSMDQLVRDALANLQSTIISPLPSSMTALGNVLPGGLSPADSALGYNSQLVEFMSPQGIRGIAAGGSQTSGGVTYSNVGGVIYQAPAAAGGSPVGRAPTAQQLQATFGGAINAFGQNVSVAPGKTGAGLLAGTTSKYFK